MHPSLPATNARAALNKRELLRHKDSAAKYEMFVIYQI